MTTHDKEQVRKAAADFIKAKEISQNELATMLDVSPATVSNLINRKWANIDARLWHHVKVYVMPSMPGELYETNDLSSVVNLCNKARQYRFMVGLVGDTGTGKTTALEAYSRRKNVFYTVYDKTMNPKQFFAVLVKKLGISFEGNIHNLINRIAEYLNTVEAPLLIVDEAGKMPRNMILYMHVLRDKTIKNCGIVLAGMPYFKENLKRGVEKEKEGIAEFFRRVNLWHTMKGLTRKEAAQILQDSGVKDTSTLSSTKQIGYLTNEILLLQTINDEI